ncbi:MAG TPA: UDP-N-acetylmuramate dehydrogenase [Bryobacteraceae bacterium]|jgi:UDP-N-acetylmuramate dehydrogenase|nr:UDP-N-acetylmuramate dehydrogenase [Bryobacteraceae bacterium]
MVHTEETLARLTAIPELTVLTHAPLSRYTRFGLGGPADVYAETASVEAFIAALTVARASGQNYVVIGGGTNLIVSDDGFRGIVLRFIAQRILAAANRVVADSGAVLQDLVDFTVDRGLQGLETLAGIPGSVGAAIYGNAGAYGHSISERVRTVRFYDGVGVRVFDKDACEFHYRESVFKRHKDWIIFSGELVMDAADAAALRKTAGDIVKVRNEKFPVTMKCAGSIFKNLLVAQLPETVAGRVPERVVREGKVPAAYFLEEVGAKGMTRGDIHVATYHANLLYNAGAGTAADLRALIADLKARVVQQFGITLEEEVQYVGFHDGVRP